MSVRPEHRDAAVTAKGNTVPDCSADAGRGCRAAFDRHETVFTLADAQAGLPRGGGQAESDCAVKKSTRPDSCGRQARSRPGAGYLACAQARRAAWHRARCSNGPSGAAPRAHYLVRTRLAQIHAATSVTGMAWR